MRDTRMIKIRLDADGLLYVARAGTLKRQQCPIERGRYCGDHCALFDEPCMRVQYKLGPNAQAGPDGSVIKIGLCQRDIVCDYDAFLDERDVKI